MCNIDTIKIASFNVNGAGNYDKQKDILDYIRKKKFDIIMLQETHWKTESENYVRNLWGYNCFVCGQSSAKNGVSILFNNTFQYTVHKVLKDDINGTYLILDVSIFDERYTITNVYGPSNRDDPDYFVNLFNKIETFGNEKVITGGDWNVILDPSMDARNYLSFNPRPRSRNVIRQNLEALELVDIFRMVYPNKKAYTWRKFNTIKQSRLDYFLISDALVTDVSFVDILPGYRSDHSIITLCIKTDMKNNNKKSYWKFNNSLLKDKLFIEKTKKVILDVVKQYALPVYNPDNIGSIEKSEILFNINDQLFFDILLVEIRGSTISYASYKKRKDQQEETELIEKINQLESLDNLDHITMLNLEELKIRLQELREYKIRGMMIRSKLNWLQHGEKPSHYFCKLEKRNFLSKRMSFLEKDDGSILYEQKEILNETMNFYKSLYASRETEDVNFDEIIQNHVKLDDTERASIEGPISFQEAIQTLKDMKNYRSPGNSGFTIEFFKFFFKDIGEFLVRAINYGFEEGKLSITQRQGVITCIPKEGKNLQQLKNWRPISLLNVSYKIASSCISNRLKLVLSKIISSTQNGFLAGRNINDNLKLMYDMLLYTENENIPGQLLLIDFHKAFDSISWSFIDKCLEYFNFGNDIRKWVKVFYTDITSCVQINGNYSEYFPIHRGVRQGDALSAYLFLICGEILSKMLHDNETIKGIKIKDKEAFLSQFADDTALFLDGSRESFEQSIHMLSKFANISGLTINFEKTIVVWLGSKKNSRDRYLRDMNFTWDPGGEINSKFKYLGIFFSTDTKSIVDLNYSTKITEIDRLLRIWNKRFLTPFGKITVIKTLALSKLTYLFSNIPDPNTNFLKQIHSLFVKFLWNSKPNKISFEYICQDNENGGINMINVFDYLTYIKVNCFKRYLYNENVFNLTNAMYPALEKVKSLGNNYLLTIVKSIQNPMICDVLKHVIKLFNKIEIQSFDEVIYECLFCNLNICIDNKPIHYRNWVTNNVTRICHLMNNRGDFLSYRDFIGKYPNIFTNFLQYNGVLNSIRMYFRKHNFTNAMNDIDLEQIQEPICWQIINQSKREIKDIIRQKPKSNHKSLEKWNNQFTQINWKHVFQICHKTTRDTKIRWFQYRLIFRTLPTNRYLNLRQIKNTSLCEFCNQLEDTISHMFWECQFVQLFWTELKNQFISKLPHAHNLTLSEELVLFGCKQNVVTDKPFDLLLLSAKYHIYLCKLNKTFPNVQVFIKQFKLRYILEKYYHENLFIESFHENWRNYVFLFD